MSEDRPLIMINVRGGVVQDVYRQGPPVDVGVIDSGQGDLPEDVLDRDSGLFRACDGTGRERAGRAYDVGTHSIEQMGKFPEMTAALEHALRE